MSTMQFNVKLEPLVALLKVKEQINADLVHEEYHQVGEDRYIGTQVYEKYYWRSQNRAALVVMADNLKGITNVRAVATGSSEGMILNIDFGAANHFAQMVEKILSDYRIR